MEEKLKHLEFIQGVVNRLASASFQMKGWSVLLLSALLVVSVQANSPESGLVALVPILVFWSLDGYFLAQERLFRRLFDHTRQQSENPTDFSMDVTRLRHSGRFWSGDWCRAALSPTLWLFYGMLVALTVLTTCIVHRTAIGQ